MSDNEASPNQQPCSMCEGSGSLIEFGRPDRLPQTVVCFDCNGSGKAKGVSEDSKPQPSSCVVCGQATFLMIVQEDKYYCQSHIKPESKEPTKSCVCEPNDPCKLHGTKSQSFDSSLKDILYDYCNVHDSQRIEPVLSAIKATVEKHYQIKEEASE